jgi:hypothetical protein
VVRVSQKYTEWSDEELQAEERRLISLYPSVNYPLSPEVDADMTRLLEVQFVRFERAQRNNPRSVLIFQPYYPLTIHRFPSVDDVKP